MLSCPLDKMFHSISALARDAHRPLEIQLQEPGSKLVTQACNWQGEFVFTVAVRAEGIGPQQIRLAVKWDGTWRGRWDESNIWVVPLRTGRFLFDSKGINLDIRIGPRAERTFLCCR